MARRIRKGEYEYRGWLIERRENGEWDIKGFLYPNEWQMTCKTKKGAMAVIRHDPRLVSLKKADGSEK